MKSDRVRYAIYTRQSAVSSSSFSSCSAQFEICLDFAKSISSPQWEWVGEHYDDVGITGENTERSALQRLLTEIRNGKIHKVIIYRLDRLTRSVRDSVEILNTLRQHNVELLIVTSPDLGRTATDTFILNMMASFAEFERDMIRSRLADTRAALKRKGHRLAGVVPFGYDIDPRTKQLVINYSEARKVEAIFQLAADGMLPSDIAKTINDSGWVTKCYKVWRTGKMHGGNQWTPRQVLDLLFNPVYIGSFSDGAGVRPGKHQAIVCRELWEFSHQQVESRRTSKRKRSKRPPFWPLRGKIVCPCCGRKMSTHSSYNGNVTYRHYRCRSHAGGRPPCKGSALPAFQIEKAVVGMLADPSLVDNFPDTELGPRNCLKRFQAVWKTMDITKQERLLPALIEQVLFREDESTLELRINMDNIVELFPEEEERKS